MASTLAFDIGGAHLKLATAGGYAHGEYFPLWERPAELAVTLGRLLQSAPAADKIVATMTGELADCFATKADGVAAIVGALASVTGGRPLHFYRTDGAWADGSGAAAEPLRVAAANWHALARFAARWIGEGCGLLIDIGSTTSDLIPIRHGRPTPRGLTDPERLRYGELVYTGVVRSPVCGVTATLPWRGTECPTPQEVFATTWDAYLLLGELPEEPNATHTADGRPATRRCAHDRLARSLCADRTMLDLEDARQIALRIRQRQHAALAAAVAQVVAAMGSPPQTVVVSGQGEFLARSLARSACPAAKIVGLTSALGPERSRAATAYALACLASGEHADPAWRRGT